MSLDSYSALKTSVGDWLLRADLTAVIPDFITLAEAQISRRLLKDGPCRRMMIRADATISTEFTALPTDFLASKTINIVGNTGTHELAFCTPEQINEKRGLTRTLNGEPWFYTVVGSEFQFFPAPTADTAAELTYWARIPALSDVVTTNWLLSYHPDAYLYGSLMQAAPYLRDDARLSLWASALETILSDIVEADKLSRTSAHIAVGDVTGGTP